MSTPDNVAAAIVFTWLAMVLAISFLEAPLKFRAPGVTVQVGLGIGRLVVRALNAVELLLDAVIVAVALAAGLPSAAVASLVVAVVCLTVQLLLIRPQLTRRSSAVLAGRDVARSHAHHLYVGAEAVKVVALLVGGIALLAS